MSAGQYKASCRCSGIQWEVHGPYVFSGLCHCLNCRRGNSTSHPVHVVAVPRDNFRITKGEDLVTTWSADGKVKRAFCKVCGTKTWNDPTIFYGCFPTTFEEVGEGSLCPEDLQPTLHVNYESRMFDFNDDIPKFIGFPTNGTPCDNKGNPI